MRDEIENIFFEVCAGAGDEMHLVLPDHFGEREASSAVLIAPRA